MQVVKAPCTQENSRWQSLDNSNRKEQGLGSKCHQKIISSVLRHINSNGILCKVPILNGTLHSLPGPVSIRLRSMQKGLFKVLQLSGSLITSIWCFALSPSTWKQVPSEKLSFHLRVLAFVVAEKGESVAPVSFKGSDT